MEVHHHAHTARKKWTHYFWEFLMLFLAVFCGFLAENQREHYIERHRAKDYAAGLFQDLKADTSELRDAILRSELLMSRADTLLNMLKLPDAEIRDSALQTLFANVSGYRYYNPTLGVYNQVKNSGSLRYFKKALIRKLTEYEGSAQAVLKVAQSGIDWRTNHLLPVLARYADFRNINVNERREVSYYGSGAITAKPLPDNTELYNTIFITRRAHLSVILNMESQLQKADSLLVMIGEMFHLTE